MFKLKRKLYLALAFIFLFTLPLNAEEKHFNILMINDTHSIILPVLEAAEADKRDGETAVTSKGGMARALWLVDSESKKIKAADPGAALFLLEAGDMALGQKGILQQGRAEYGALALLGFDAGVLGNHEFDGGAAELKKMAKNMDMPVLASNITFKDPELNRKFIKNLILEKDGVKMGLFGLVTPNLTSIISNPAGFTVEQDIYKTAEKQVALLKKANVDVIVAVNHIGLDLDKRLAQTVDGISVIVGGHSHDVIRQNIFIRQPKGGYTLIGQAGSNGRYAGRFSVTVDDGRLLEDKSSWQLLKVTKETPELPAAEALGEKARDDIAKALKIRGSVGKLKKSVDMRNNAVRTKENAMGDVIADASRSAASADIGFVNGGGLRLAKIVPPGDFNAADMLDMLPYGNALQRAEVKGSEIRRLLELSASALKGRNDAFDAKKRPHSGEFMQMSGLRVTFDLSAAPSGVINGKTITPGSRVKKAEVQSAADPNVFVPLDDDAVYTVGMSPFVASFLNVNSTETLPQTELQAVSDYISSKLNGEIDPHTDGRITIINGAEQAIE